MDRREFLVRAGGGAAALAALGGVGFGISRAAAAFDDPRVFSFRSRPDLRPPQPWVTGTAGGPGAIFHTPMGGPGQTGALILDQAGQPVWFSPSPKGRARLDFRVQEYRGRPHLTWWEGKVAKGYGTGAVVVADRTYREVARIEAGDGQQADLHDVQLTRDGTVLLLAYPKVGKIVEGVVQEIDLASGRVLLDWHSLDHVPVSESYRTPQSFGKAGFDYLHANSIGVAPDGDLILSARHTWTVYKLDRETGRIRWRLGGSRSDFELGPGVRFAWQHDARMHDDGTLTMFDNGAEPAVEPRTRILRIAVDEPARKTRLVSAWTHARGLSAIAMGNAQLLDDGGIFVGWGTQPYASELGPDGFERWDAAFPAQAISYRVYRLPWEGAPAERPKAVRSAGAVHVSWNGDTRTAVWEARSGGRVVGRARRSGFETTVPAAGSGGPLEVAAVGADGSTLATVEV